MFAVGDNVWLRSVKECGTVEIVQRWPFAYVVRVAYGSRRAVWYAVFPGDVREVAS